MGSIISLLFFGALGYGVYWLFGRPKQADGTPAHEPFLKDDLEYPRLFGVSIVALLVAYNIFGYDIHVGLGLAVVQAVAALALFLCLPKEKKNPVSLALTALAVVSAGAIAYRANGFVQSFNGVVYTLSMFVLLMLLVVDQVRWTGMWIMRYLFTGIWNSFGHVVRLFQHTSQKKGANFSIGALLKTTVITIVVLAVFVGLLTQADPIFAKLVDNIWEEALGRVVASVILVIVATVFLTMRLRTQREDTKQPLSFLNFQDLFVPGLAVSIAFALFLAIQAKYLFSVGSAATEAGRTLLIESQLKEYGLTLSQYVRKGFIELLTAAFFGGLLSYCISLVSRHYDEKDAKSLYLKILNSALLVELMFLLGSAWKRNALYMDVYGLTRVRFVGVLFLMWLVGFLALLLLFAVWKKWNEAKLFLGILALSTCVFVGLNIQNIDQMIVNASPSHHNFRDYFYLTALSEDGRDGWPMTVAAAEALVPTMQQKNEFTEIDKAQLANVKMSLIALTEKRQKLEEKYMPYEELRTKRNQETAADNSVYKGEVLGEDVPEHWNSKRKWQSWQYAEHQGFMQMANDRATYTDKVSNLLKQIEELQKTKKLELYAQEQRLLFELKYPFLNVNLQYYPRSLDMINNDFVNGKPVPASTATLAPTPVPSPVPGGNCDYLPGLLTLATENATACTLGSNTFYECNPGYKKQDNYCVYGATGLASPMPTPVPTPSPVDTPY